MALSAELLRLVIIDVVSSPFPSPSPFPPDSVVNREDDQVAEVGR